MTAFPPPPPAVVTDTIRHEYATINGVRLHYARQGHGELIVFLHGFPEFWYAWKDQLAEFGQDHLAVAPDTRGHNLSEAPSNLEGYRAAVIVEDIRALAEHLNGGKPFVLVGHDWGGAIAWGFAARHPALVKKLIIINAPHPTVFDRELESNAAQQKASQYMLLFRSPQAETVLSANNYQPLLNIFSELKAMGKFTEADARAYLEAWSRPGSLTAGLNLYRAARVGPPSEGAARERIGSGFGADQFRVKVPTLVIWGEKDEALLTGNLVGLDEYVPDLRIERMPEGTHWVIHEFPAEINRRIRSFLAAP